MIGLDDFINEMSALNNRSNASLRDKRAGVEDEYNQKRRELASEYGKKFDDIDAEMRKNSKEDMLRILAQAGIKSGGKSKDIYDFAVQMCGLILRADKPYGAFYALLVLLQERAEEYGNAEMKAELDGLLESKEVEKLIFKDKEYIELEKKRSGKLKGSDKHKKERTELAQQIRKLEDKYSALMWYRERNYYGKNIFR
jgi:hypothetical protein